MDGVYFGEVLDEIISSRTTFDLSPHPWQDIQCVPLSTYAQINCAIGYVSEFLCCCIYFLFFYSIVYTPFVANHNVGSYILIFYLSMV